MIVFGIDPGASGAIAVLNVWNEEGAKALFIKLDNTEADVAEWFRNTTGTLGHAFIERVHSMPAQGVSSSFKFGQNYGFLRGLLIGMRMRFEEVTPQRWQKEIGCLTKGDKNVSKSKAQQLFPDMKITHANADALLIAEYGRRELVKRYGSDRQPALLQAGETT